MHLMTKFETATSIFLACALLLSVARGEDEPRKLTSLTTSDGSLPMGDMNLVVLTDLHGWLGGHRYNKEKGGAWEENSVSNATYGDVFSMYERITEQYRNEGKDVFIVMNGDFYNGTGLSCAPHALATLVSEMYFDAFATSCQELINANESEVEFFEEALYSGGLVTSNVKYKKTGESLGVRHKSFNNWLVLGFLDGEILADIPPQIEIESIETALGSAWFWAAIKEQQWDGVVALCHMSRDSGSIMSIVTTIRTVYQRQYNTTEEIPVIFTTSYETTNNTYAKVYTDDPSNKTFIFQAGKNLETIGIVVYAGAEFNHTFIQANTNKMQAHCYDKPCDTEYGKNMTSNIEKVRNATCLLNETGGRKLTDTYYANPRTDNEDLNLFYVDTVMREVTPDEKNCLIHPRTAFRNYSYLPGKVSLIRDDVFTVMKACSENRFYVVAEKLAAEDIKKLEDKLNDPYKVEDKPKDPSSVVWHTDKICKDKTGGNLVTIEDEVLTVNEALVSLDLIKDDFTPEQVYRNLTATSIWWEFLKMHPEDEKEKSGNYVGFIVILCSVVGAVVLIAAVLYLRQICYRAKSPYRLVSGITNLDDDDDDEDDAMVPSYHKQAGRVELPDFGRSTSSDVTGL